MIRLKRPGHVALIVGDVERSKAFYRDVLGLEIREEDPEHGGTFMGLPNFGHNVDLFPTQTASGSDQRLSGQRVHHFAFQVDSHEDLREAYRTLKGAGVEILAAVDHQSQHSIYVRDPDGNTVEIYWELPDAVEIFRRGRGDRDLPLTFDDPA